MHQVEFRDDKSFGRALSTLIYDMPGTFFVRSRRGIVVGDKELEALKKAGLVDANGKSKKENKRGAKTKAKQRTVG